jgi:hypothetical protein
MDAQASIMLRKPYFHGSICFANISLFGKIHASNEIGTKPSQDRIFLSNKKIVIIMQNKTKRKYEKEVACHTKLCAAERSVVSPAGIEPNFWELLKIKEKGVNALPCLDFHCSSSVAKSKKGGGNRNGNDHYQTSSAGKGSDFPTKRILGPFQSVTHTPKPARGRAGGSG